MVRYIIVILLLLTCVARSEEGGPGKSKNKTETAQAENQHTSPTQQIIVPSSGPTPTVINIYTGKYAEDESSCTQPKDWEKWISFALCQSARWLNAERIIAVWTVVLGIATCFLGLATWRLWGTTEGLVRGAETTAERQLRAYISVNFAQMINIESDKEFRAGFIFRNDGLTPAHEVQQNSVIKLIEWPLPENFPFPPLNPERRSSNNLSPRNALASFSEAFDHTLCQGRAITQSDLIQILTAPAHGRRLAIFGEVQYRDEFEKSRFTRFCASFAGNKDLLALAQQGNWQLISQVTRQQGFAWNWELSNQHNIAT